VIDDDPLVGSAVRRVLSAQHDVVAITDPTAALRLVEADPRFDVVLCDVQMPGIDGMQVHAELGRIAPELAARTVFVTGGLTTEAARTFAASHPLLRKPFSIDELRTVIAAIAG
jgi:CheY-like chemotaxis protein